MKSCCILFSNILSRGQVSKNFTKANQVPSNMFKNPLECQLNHIVFILIRQKKMLVLFTFTNTMHAMCKKMIAPYMSCKTKTHFVALFSLVGIVTGSTSPMFLSKKFRNISFQISIYYKILNIF